MRQKFYDWNWSYVGVGAVCGQRLFMPQRPIRNFIAAK